MTRILKLALLLIMSVAPVLVLGQINNPGGSGGGSSGSGVVSAVASSAVTIGTAATDIKVSELALPAGYFNFANQVANFTAQGFYTTVAAQTPTITEKIKLCSVSGCGSGTVIVLYASPVSGATTASVSNTFQISGTIGTTATGGTGTLITKASTDIVLGATGGTNFATPTPTVLGDWFVDANTTSSSAIDLTQAWFLDLMFNLSTGTTNTVTPSSFTIFGGGVAAPVASVANSDGTLTINPTTGTVIAGLNLAHANVWTGQQTGSGFNNLFAAPPAIGGTTPAAGTFNALTDTAMSGGPFCVQETSGVLSSTGLACGSGGGGAVSSVSNSDGSLTISPTTGAVVGSLNPAHANTWTANQTASTGSTFAPSGSGIIQANQLLEPVVFWTNDVTGSDLCARVTTQYAKCPSGALGACKIYIQPTTPGSIDTCATGTSDWEAGNPAASVWYVVLAQVQLSKTVHLAFTPHKFDSGGGTPTFSGGKFLMNSSFTSTATFANGGTSTLAAEGPAGVFTPNVLFSDGDRSNGSTINQWQSNAFATKWNDVPLDCNLQPNCIPYYTANRQEGSEYNNVRVMNNAPNSGTSVSYCMFFDHYAAQTGNSGPSHFHINNSGCDPYPNSTGITTNNTIYGIVYEGINCPPATCTVTGGSASATGGNISIIGGTIRGAGSTQLMQYGVWIDATQNDFISNVHCEWQSTNCVILGANGNATTASETHSISDVNNPVNAVHFHAGGTNVAFQSDNGITDDVNSCNPAANVDAYFQANASGWWSGVFHVACVSTTIGNTTAATQFDPAYYSGSGSSSTLAGMNWQSSIDGVAQYLTETTSAGNPVAPVPLPAGVAPNASTCPSNVYTVLLSDRAKYVSFNDAAACAVTLPQAGTTGFANNFLFATCDIGAGTSTITPTTSTISYSAGTSYTSAAASMSLTTGQCAFIYSDNTNYFAIKWGGTSTIFSGTSTMGTGAISSGTCAAAVTTAAAGVATTDSIIATPNTDPTAVTGYAPSASGSLYIQAYPTSGNVNFKVCNNTSGSITPSALTLNWRVVR